MHSFIPSSVLLLQGATGLAGYFFGVKLVRSGLELSGWVGFGMREFGIQNSDQPLLQL